jgi:hypothetical protein
MAVELIKLNRMTCYISAKDSTFNNSEQSILDVERGRGWSDHPVRQSFRDIETRGLKLDDKR